MVEKNGSVSSLMKPTTPNTLDSIELETREKNFDSRSTTDKSNDVDLEQNAVSNTEGEKVNGENSSEFDVWWNEPADQDPANPMNWTNKKKWSNIAVMSAITFLT